DPRRVVDDGPGPFDGAGWPGAGRRRLRLPAAPGPQADHDEQAGGEGGVQAVGGRTDDPVPDPPAAGRDEPQPDDGGGGHRQRRGREPDPYRRGPGVPGGAGRPPGGGQGPGTHRRPDPGRGREARRPHRARRPPGPYSPFRLQTGPGDPRRPLPGRRPPPGLRVQPQRAHGRLIPGPKGAEAPDRPAHRQPALQENDRCSSGTPERGRGADPDETGRSRTTETPDAHRRSGRARGVRCKGSVRPPGRRCRAAHGRRPSHPRSRVRSTRLSQVGVPAAVVAIVVMMVVPLPTMLLDLLLVCNLAGATVILLVSMNVRRTLDFSIFPSLLLIATLFRLALNVSSTRLVLLHGNAGKVIESF